MQEGLEQLRLEQGWQSHLSRYVSDIKKRKTELISILTESFVGALALDEKNMERDFADQLKIMFADKPDNCEEVAKEDLDNLIAIDRNNGEEAEEATLEEIHGSIDANQDGIFTCNEILENLFKALLYQNQNSKFHQ